MAGQNGLVSVGLEFAEGIPWHDWFHLPFISETGNFERPSEPSPNIDGSGNVSRGDNLEATGAASIICNPNSEDLLVIRAHHRGYYEVEEVETGVHLWTFRDIDKLVDTPVAHYLDTMALRFWRDQKFNPSLYTVLGAKCSQLQITQDAFAHSIFQHDFLPLRDTKSSVVQQAVNVAFTAEPSIRGHRIKGDKYGDYFKFKITDAGVAGGFAESAGVWGKGTGAYGTTEYPLSTIMDVMNADDTRYAPREEPYQLLWAVPVGHVFTLNDEIRIYPTHPAPVAVLSSRPRFDSRKCEIVITLEGETITKRPYENYNITIAAPKEAIGGIGSKYNDTVDVPQDGRKYCDVSFQSTYLSDEFADAIIDGAEADIVVTFYGGKIGSTGLDDYARYSLTGAEITEGGIEGIQNAGRNPETVTMRASTCVETYQNTVASIAPTA